MASGLRKTDPAKWAKSWFRKLSALEKCFWLYLCDACDWAGVWEPDFELAAFKLGEEVDESTMAAFGAKVEQLSNGKYWIVGFIDFQQPGGLKANNNAHLPIFRSIEKNKVPYKRCSLGADEGLKEGLKQPPCKVTSTSSNVDSNVSSVVREGGPGETATLAEYIADLRALRPEFARLPEFGITNTFGGADRAVWSSAYAEFRRDMVNTLKLPDNPLKLLAGYFRNAGNTTPKGKAATRAAANAGVDLDQFRQFSAPEAESCNA